MSMLGAAVKSALLPLIYRYPPSVLAPERLAVYLHTLLERAPVPGAVGEVGCNLAGTSVIAATLLRRIGAKKDYICFDTFSGFVSDQFEADVKLGTPRKDKSMFAANSAKLVRRILDYHDCPEVQLVEGDFTAIDQGELPSAFSVVLLDIDLSEPTYASLGRIWPRLSPGGVILVGLALSSLLEIKRIRVGNFLPALAIAPLIVWVLTQFGLM